jgi:hypothetical protein
MLTSDSVPKVACTLPQSREEAPPCTVARNWELDVERGPNWLFVKVNCGGADLGGLPPLASRLRSLLELNLTSRIVLELDQTNLPCSYLLRQLERLDRWLRSRNGVLRLCGLRARDADRLRRGGLSDRCGFYRDRGEAVFGTRRPS